MPCRCDYMEPTVREVYLSRVRSFLDELERGGIRDARTREGNHAEVYNKGVDPVTADGWVSDLCSYCTALGEDIRYCTLELQIWWRDHQIADAKRK